jgi:hypothetical protein
MPFSVMSYIVGPDMTESAYFWSVFFKLFHVLCMSVDCIVFADDNLLLDFISIKNLNFRNAIPLT